MSRACLAPRDGGVTHGGLMRPSDHWHFPCQGHFDLLPKEEFDKDSLAADAFESASVLKAAYRWLDPGLDEAAGRCGRGGKGEGGRGQ